MLAGSGSISAQSILLNIGEIGLKRALTRNLIKGQLLRSRFYGTFIINLLMYK